MKKANFYVGRKMITDYEKEMVILDNWRVLAEAIVEVAIKDYAEALKVLKAKPHNSVCRGAKMSSEKFFKSEWFNMLSDIDPEFLIKNCKRLAGY